MRMLIVSLVALMLVSGTAWAQDFGPEYFRKTNNVAVGNKILLNTNYRVNPTPTYNIYVISDESKFYVTGYRYLNGAWTKVFPAGTYASAESDTAIYWTSLNVALPIHQRIDLLYVRAATNGAAVTTVVYK